MTSDGQIEDLGVLLTAALDLDTGWMPRGACYGYGCRNPESTTPWQAAPTRTYDGMSGSELVKWALIVCRGCPAQYDCAAYAVEGWMIAGTWSMPLTHLAWLRKQPDWEDIIADARQRKVPIQDAVALLRAKDA